MARSTAVSQVIASTLRRFGAFDGCLYLLNAAAARCTGGRLRLRRYYLMAQPLDIKLPSPRSAASGYETRVITGNDDASAAFPRPPQVLRDRYAQGSVCIAMCRDAKLAGFIWLSTGSYEEDEVRCRYVPHPPESTAWDYDLYVAPEFRGGFAFLRLWADTIRYLQNRGIAWSLSRISAFNPESLAAHRRMSALQIGNAFFFDVFGMQLTIATVWPYCHVTWGNRRGPKFVLRAPVVERVCKGTS